MFASPSPTNYRLSKCTSSGAIKNSPEQRRPIFTRDKLKEKIIRNYMIKYNLSQVSENLTKEVNKFFLKPSLNNKDFKNLDNQLVKIINNRESSNDKISSPANLFPIKNADGLSVSKSGLVNLNKNITRAINLPTILSKSVNKLNIRTESRESYMSGCTELSKFSQPDIKKKNLEILLKEYTDKKEQISSPNLIKVEDVEKIKEDHKKVYRNVLKKELESQIDDKNSRKSDYYKSSRDYDLNIIKVLKETVNPEDERESYLRNRRIEQKIALDLIMKEEKQRKSRKEKEERKFDKETSIIVQLLKLKSF